MKATELGYQAPRLLLFGASGVGKTTAVGKIHRLLKAHNTEGIRMFDFDLGANVLRLGGFDVDLGDDPYAYVERKEAKGTVIPRFVQEFTGYEKDPSPFGGFCVDSLSGFEVAVKNYILRINDTKRQQSFIPSQNDWGAIIAFYKSFFPQLSVISRHSMLIVTAHLRLLQNELTGVITETPAIAGKDIPTSLGKHFNEVWRLDLEGSEENPKRVIQTGASRMHKCKTQIPDLPFKCSVDEAVEALVHHTGLEMKKHGVEFGAAPIS